MMWRYSNQKFKALLTDRSFGNVDPRYDHYDEQKKHLLIDAAEPFKVAWMKAQGKTHIETIKQGNMTSNWNEFSCDVLISPSGNYAFALFPADCVPIVLWAPEKSLLCFVHAGRRNTEAGIIEMTLEELAKNHKIKAAQLEAYIGPSIRKESYFFKQIEEAQKKDLLWKPYVTMKDSNYHIDLLGYILQRLERQGIKSSNIVIDKLDTGLSTNYFSHSRSARTGEIEGRNCLLIVPNNEGVAKEKSVA